MSAFHPFQTLAGALRRRQRYGSMDALKSWSKAELAEVKASKLLPRRAIQNFVDIDVLGLADRERNATGK